MLAIVGVAEEVGSVDIVEGSEINRWGMAVKFSIGCQNLCSPSYRYETNSYPAELIILAGVHLVALL